MFTPLGRGPPAVAYGLSCAIGFSYAIDAIDQPRSAAGTGQPRPQDT